MARLIYPDLVALIELQLDVLAGNYAAERDDEMRRKVPCMQRDNAPYTRPNTKNGQPDKD